MEIRTIDGRQVAVMEFDSWTHFIETANGPGTRPDSERVSRKDSESYGRGGYWEGTRTYADAQELARIGWKEGAEKIAPILAAMVAKVPEKKFKPEIVFSPVGPGTLDFGRFLQDYPAPYMVWQDSELEVNQPNPRGIVKIVINASARGSISSEQLFWRGAAVAALADILEKSNYRVEIEMIAFSTQNKGALLIVPLKRASEPMEMEFLAFACANGATLRRFCFGARETLPEEFISDIGYFNGGGYGIPTDLPSGDIYVGTAQNWGSLAEASRWVAEELRKQGIELES